MAQINENDLEKFREQIDQLKQANINFTDSIKRIVIPTAFTPELLERFRLGAIEHGKRIKLFESTTKQDFKTIKKRSKYKIREKGEYLPDFERFYDFFLLYIEEIRKLPIPEVLRCEVKNYDFTLYHHWENYQSQGFDEIYSLVKVWEEVDVRNLKKLLLLPEKKVQEVMNRESFERLFFSVSVFQGFVKKLVEEELIEEATFIFKGKGKMFFAGIIKSLHRRSYTKRKLTNNEVLDVCNNVFGAGMKLDSVKKGEANSRDLNKYLPPYTNTTTNGI
jgi:hypothetical protein